MKTSGFCVIALLSMTGSALAAPVVAQCHVTDASLFRADDQGRLRPVPVDAAGIALRLVKTESGDLDVVTVTPKATASLRESAPQVQVAFFNGAAMLSGITPSGAAERFFFQLGPQGGQVIWTVIRNFRDSDGAGRFLVDTATYVGDCH